MSDPYDTALELADKLLGRPLELPLGPGEPESGREFRRLATLHTFGDSWSASRGMRPRPTAGSRAPRAGPLLSKRAHPREVSVTQIAFVDPHVKAFPPTAPGPAEPVIHAQLKQQTPPTSLRCRLGGTRMRERRVLAKDVPAREQLAGQRHVPAPLIGIPEQPMHDLELVRAVVDLDPLALGELLP